MAILIISAIIVLVMIGLSGRANAQFRGEARLPMQWSMSGSVNWSAPRAVALSFTPMLAMGVLMLFNITVMTGQVRPGQEDLALPVLVALGALLIGVHLLHLWLMHRTLRPRRGR